MDDTDKLMANANAALRSVMAEPPLAGITALLVAAARLAERSGIPRDTIHVLVGAAYSASAQVGNDDETAPMIRARKSRRGRVGARAKRARKVAA